VIVGEDGENQVFHVSRRKTHSNLRKSPERSKMQSTHRANNSTKTTTNKKALIVNESGAMRDISFQ
jgi:hypothetical protein